MREGFWYSSREPNLPRPHSDDFPWPDRDKFLSRLDIIQGRQSTEIIQYRGYSSCRICGKMNGYREFKTDGWEWPEGYMHYVEEHNVRPSLAFQEYVCEGVK